MAYFVIIQEHTKLQCTDSQISLVEFVRNVPSKRTEFTAFLNQGVEEAKREQELLEHRRILTSVEEIQVAYRVVQVRSAKKYHASIKFT